MMTDKELYVAFLEGDKKAFETLVLRHRHQLVYFVMQYTHSFESAEDIVQELFAAVYIKPNMYDAKYSLKTFLYTIAKRRAIDLMRRETKISPQSIEEHDIEDVRTLESIIFEREDLKSLRKALGEIKEEYARVIVLTQLDGLTMEQAASVLGKNLSSTKVLLHRARKSLKQKMGRE